MIELLHLNGIIGDLERTLADRIGVLFGDPSPELAMAVALTARAVTSGHTCLNLDEVDPSWAEGIAIPDWSSLHQSPAVGSIQRPHCPLILHQNKLYLRRYWRYETELVDAIHQRLQSDPFVVDTVYLQQLLDRLFGSTVEHPQRLAVQNSVSRRLTVISGGPGTGKTTTVVRLIAALQAMTIRSGYPPLRLLLTAPTGKAAARLSESIRIQKSKLDIDESIRDLIPEQASTLHRALGTVPDIRSRFKHDRNNLLPIDGIVIDECSMVDLSLMARTLEAIPPGARIILLGDRDQLASVEAGAIFGDLCQARPVIKQLTHLEQSWRFDADRGIGRLARLVNAGDSSGVLELLSRSTPRFSATEVCWLPYRNLEEMRHLLSRRIVEGYQGMWHTQDPEQALEKFGQFRILCAHRRGPLGVEDLNRMATERALAFRSYRSELWYLGRPIVVTENAPDSRLYNGDTGIAWPSPDGFRVQFGIDHEQRQIAASRLPSHETAYAMTVHKSQGSEFDEVLIVLPPTISPITTRELLYTAITRARHRVTLVGSVDVISVATHRRISRASGLCERLESL